MGRVPGVVHHQEGGTSMKQGTKVGGGGLDAEGFVIIVAQEPAPSRLGWGAGRAAGPGWPRAHRRGISPESGSYGPSLQPGSIFPMPPKPWTELISSAPAVGPPARRRAARSRLASGRGTKSAGRGRAWKILTPVCGRSVLPAGASEGNRGQSSRPALGPSDRPPT